MDKKLIVASNEKIFATGVFLRPALCTINGMQQWRWVAVGFEDDSYYDGKYIDPFEYADTLEGLVNFWDGEDDEDSEDDEEE